MATSLGSALRPLFNFALSAQVAQSQTLMSPEPVPEMRYWPFFVKFTQLTEFEKQESLPRA